MAQTKGVTQVILKIGKFEKTKLSRIKTAIVMTQTKVADEAKSNHPYTDRTQNLTNSIQPARIDIGRSVIMGEVRANMEYADFVERGTSRAKAYPFLAPAVLKHAGFFKRMIEKALR